MYTIRIITITLAILVFAHFDATASQNDSTADAGATPGTDATTSRRIAEGSDGVGRTSKAKSTRADSSAVAAPPINATSDPARFDNVLEKFERTETLRLVGQRWNNTLIGNCKIHVTR